MRLLFLSFVWLFSITYALDLRGAVQWSGDCAGMHDLHSSRVIIDDGRMKGGIISDGSFVVADVPPGTYLLSVVSKNYAFDQFRIDVLNDTVQVRPCPPGTPLNPPSNVLLPYPIVLIPRQKHVYFIPRETFNLIGMLSNPMMLMMIAAAAMMFATPYLMKNMDPEVLEEFKAQQAKMHHSIAGKDTQTSTVIQGKGEAGKRPQTSTRSRGGKNRKHTA